MLTESKEITKLGVTATVGTANNITLSGQAIQLTISANAAVRARLGATVVATGAGAKFFIVPANFAIIMYPKPATVVLNVQKIGTGTATVTVLESL